MTRPNAKRSGGPMTTEGKSVAASNSLTTGAYAMTVILPGEDETAFRQLEAQFIRDFAPRDIAEATMVRDLAVLTWKKMRLDRIEHAAMMQELNKPFEAFEFYRNKLLNHEVANKLLGLEGSPEENRRAYEKACELLGGTLSAKIVPVLQRDYPLIFKAIAFLAETEFREPIPQADWATETVVLKSEEEVPFLGWAMEQFLQDYIGLERVFDDLEAAQAEIRQAQAKRLLKFLDARAQNRAQDHIDRAFYRTLGELRRHQGWRRSLSEITVNTPPTPEVIPQAEA